MKECHYWESCSEVTILPHLRSASDDVFFSLSVVGDDISVVLDSRDLAR